MHSEAPLADLVGAHALVPCVDGSERPYRDLDSAASTPALETVAARVAEFLPWYSSVHRGAGYKSRRATAAYEEARESAHRFARRPAGGDDVVVLVRNTTEAINHLAYRLGLGPSDVVVTTVVEHHANLLALGPYGVRAGGSSAAPKARSASTTSCGCSTTARGPALLAVTGASNVTGWLPPVEEICAAAHARGVRVLVDAAQLAPHRPLPPGPDFVAFSGHKLYAPFGAGALIGPRETFESGDPFLAGGGAVDLVDLDEVIWTEPPEREEAGSPNVVGVVAFGTAMDELERIGWDSVRAHEAALCAQLQKGLRSIPGVHVLGPAFDEPRPGAGPPRRRGVHGGRHASRAGSGAAQRGIRSGRPARLLLRAPLPDPPARRRERRTGRGKGSRAPRRPQRHPRRGAGQLRARHVELRTWTRCSTRCARLAAGTTAPVTYVQDRVTGDYWPEGDAPGWTTADRPAGAACARG